MPVLSFKKESQKPVLGRSSDQKSGFERASRPEQNKFPGSKKKLIFRRASESEKSAFGRGSVPENPPVGGLQEFKTRKLVLGKQKAGFLEGFPNQKSQFSRRFPELKKSAFGRSFRTEKLVFGKQKAAAFKMVGVPDQKINF
jgi:hypothetical protein